MGILLGGCGCEASPLLLSLSVVVGGRGGVGASSRCCGLLLIRGLGKDIRLHVPESSDETGFALGVSEREMKKMVIVDEKNDKVR